MAPMPDAVLRLPARALVAAVRVYQRLISPLLPRRCKYEPTCSAYALAAIRQHGAVRGSILAAWRVLRCNPFSHGGYDPVSAQRLFQPRGERRERKVAA
jgi:putative membrane protein insertion efficiency factor